MHGLKQRVLVALTSLVLLLQPLFQMAFALNPTQVIAQETLKSEITYSNNTFHVSINTSEEIDYLLSYRTDKQTEAITGKSEKSETNFVKYFFAGTCSSDEACINHNVIRGLLKTNVQATNYLNVKRFTIDFGQLNIVLNEVTNSLEISDVEKKWLEDGVDLSPPATPAPTEEPTPTPEGEILDGIFTDEPSDASETPQTDESTETEELQSDETLTINVIEDIDTTLLLFDENALIFDSSATLSTNKEDYAPTDIAIISGSGFNAEETYTLVITSEDEPAVRFEVHVQADLHGEFIYLYQLDGIYRPDYKAETYNKEESLVAIITFKDSTPTLNITRSGSGGGIITSNDEFINCVASDGSTSGDCSKTYGENNPDVILTAVADSESLFDGWNGGTCSGTSTCTPSGLTGNQTVTVEAIFNAIPPSSITISKLTDPSDDDSSVFEFTGDLGDFTLVGNGSSQTFDNLEPGEYSLEELVPDGWDLTDASCTDESFINGGVINVSAGEDVECSFTNTKRGQVVVTKYHDENANGIRDDGEKELGGWEINLTDSDENTETQATGDDEEEEDFGQATFSNLVPEIYFLSEEIQPEWDISNIACGDEIENEDIDDSNSHEIEISVGETLNCEVGNYQNGQIIVKKNVVKPNGDPVLDQSTSFTFNFTGQDSFELQDEDGGQSFDVKPGTYDVTEDLPENYDFDGCEAVYDGDSVGEQVEDGVQVTVDSGDTVTVTCTNKQKVSSISGLKFNDLDGDGIQDEGEGGLDGWTIFLDLDDNGTLDEDETFITTDADGNYTFEDLDPGTYAIREVLKALWTQTTEDPEDITLLSGDDVEGVNFGNEEIPPEISNEAESSVLSNSVTIVWDTDHPATSRVIYDTVSHATADPTFDDPLDKYGYANTTDEFDTSPKVTDHSVGLTGLTAGTTYYYRTISRGSPEAISNENSFITTASSTSSSSTGSSTGGVSTPTCSETKPGSAPSGLSAIGGLNSVRLTWNKASDPVSYYLVTYGLSSGSQAFGNPNVGNSSTTSYTVSNLSGGITYYFKVRAGNGCAPGEFSSEVSATPTGGFVEGPAAGFAPGVLGAATEEAKLNEEVKNKQTLGEFTKTAKQSSFIKYLPFIAILVLLFIFLKRKNMIK